MFPKPRVSVTARRRIAVATRQRSRRSALGKPFELEVAVQTLVESKAIADTDIARKPDHVDARHAAVEIPRAVVDQFEADLGSTDLEYPRRESPVVVAAACPQQEQQGKHRQHEERARDRQPEHASVPRRDIGPTRAFPTNDQWNRSEDNEKNACCEPEHSRRLSYSAARVNSLKPQPPAGF